MKHVFVGLAVRWEALFGAMRLYREIVRRVEAEALMPVAFTHISSLLPKQPCGAVSRGIDSDYDIYCVKENGHGKSHSWEEGQ